MRVIAIRADAQFLVSTARLRPAFKADVEFFGEAGGGAEVDGQEGKGLGGEAYVVGLGGEVVDSFVFGGVDEETERVLGPCATVAGAGCESCGDIGELRGCGEGGG